MFRKNISPDSGMLFIFEKNAVLNFWMKNTYIPLSVAFIDSDGIIKEIQDMKPLDSNISYLSSSRVKYALEVNSGWFSEHGVGTGHRIDLSGCISKQN